MWLEKMEERKIKTKKWINQGKRKKKEVISLSNLLITTISYFLWAPDAIMLQFFFAIIHHNTDIKGSVNSDFSVSLFLFQLQALEIDRYLLYKTSSVHLMVLICCKTEVKWKTWQLHSI